MLIKNDIYQISIIRDETFSMESTDNKPYEILFNPDNLKKSDYFKAFYISIEKNCNKRQIVLVGSLFGSDDNIAILENNDLIVLMNTMIIVIDCLTLTIKTQKHIPDNGCYFSIHRFDSGYIVYGELEIVKLTKQFDVEWTFSGADIFVTCDGNIPFTIENNNIHLIDWNGKKYHVNKHGKEVFKLSKHFR